MDSGGGGLTACRFINVTVSAQLEWESNLFLSASKRISIRTNVDSLSAGPSGINPAEVAASSPQLPYPTQHQGAMPIPYGATPTTPYPAYIPPPMPTTYNPYATMPYPTQGIHGGTSQFYRP